MIQTIYAGEVAEFRLKITFLSGYKEATLLKVLEPPAHLKIGLDKKTVDSSQPFKVTIRAPRDKDDIKYKLWIEAQSKSQRMVYPLVLNIFKKEEKTKIAVDFVSRDYNTQGTGDIVVGRVMPPKKTDLNLSLALPQGEPTIVSTTSDARGNFTVPFNRQQYGLYNVVIQVNGLPVAPGLMQASAQDTIRRLEIWTGYARNKTVGDTLMIFGRIRPSAGIVPVGLNIRGPAHLGNQFVTNQTALTDSKGDFQSTYIIPAEGLFTIKGTYNDAGVPRVDETVALIGPDTRPGIFVFIVGGRDYYGINPATGFPNGNSYWDVENLIVKDIYRRLNMPPFPLQAGKDDIIYFNYMDIQNLDGDDIPNDVVTIPLPGMAPLDYRKNEYKSDWIVSEVRNRIGLRCNSLLTKVPLYLIMLGEGTQLAAGTKVFRPKGDHFNRPPVADYLDADQIIQMFCPNPCPPIVKEVKGHKKETGIDRVFLLLSCDYAGRIADQIRNSINLCWTDCNFKIATPVADELMNYPNDTAKKKSFSWQFLDKLLTLRFPELYNDCYTPANAEVFRRVDGINALLTLEGSPATSPGWWRVPGCADDSFPTIPR